MPRSVSKPSRSSTPSRTVVVKVGSAVLAPRGVLDVGVVARLCDDLASVRRLGWSVVLVSSGAVASGFAALGLKAPPKEIVLKQAAAAIGQQRLMAAYADAFAPHGVTIAQVLLTADDFDHRARHLNARGTLNTLLAHGVIPIINENDSVSFAEIKLGDNDRLSALVAGLVHADRLIILSTARGLYERADPRRVIPVVTSLGDARAHVGAGASSVGTGGMVTKLDAVAIAAAAGVHTVIAGGDEPRAVQRLLAGEAVGTRFDLAAPAVRARKRWIGYAARARGVILVDDGARRAVVERGASLLPSGVVGVRGAFDAGSVVDLATEGGSAFARGRASYGADDIRRLKGVRAGQIASILGYVYRDEIVHRDDLHVLDGTRPKRKERGS